MKDNRFKSYIYWGVTAFAVIAASVGVVFLMLHIDGIRRWADQTLGILAPVIYGAVLAYLLSPIYNKCQSAVEQLAASRIRDMKKRRHLAKTCATIVSLIVLTVVVTGLISMLLPQLISSIQGILDSLPTNFENLSMWLQRILEDNPDQAERIMEIYNRLVTYLQNWLNNTLLPNLDIVIAQVSNKVWSAVVVLKNILIGIIVMIYLLNIKVTLAAQCKKLSYSLLPVRGANILIEEVNRIHRIFGGFIMGKLLDSLIIGILCFICMSLMKLPYVLLVSVIVGVTNIIPFFGPFIGAIPSAFLILLVSPMQCLYFLIFVLVLQQFDGNILGPKILGDSTGLPSFWVLFSILLFGGWFGFVGMIIAVPTFAVLLNLIRRWSARSLRKKGLSADTEAYRDMNDRYQTIKSETEK